MSVFRRQVTWEWPMIKCSCTARTGWDRMGSHFAKYSAQFQRRRGLSASGEMISGNLLTWRNTNRLGLCICRRFSTGTIGIFTRWWPTCAVLMVQRRPSQSRSAWNHRLWPVRANRGTIFPGRSFGETAHNKLNNVVEDSKDSCL